MPLHIKNPVIYRLHPLHTAENSTKSSFMFFKLKKKIKRAPKSLVILKTHR